MRTYIHLSSQKKKGRPHYNPLLKVAYILDQLMEGMRKAWIPGDKCTADESMIWYMGCAVSFVQYMPQKPIKHGLKVFALCCAYTSVLLGFEVYCGTESNQDSSALGVIQCVLAKAHLATAHGRTPFTDNWYTMVELAKWLFDKHGKFFCGTQIPTTKVARQDMDLPFCMLSNGGLHSVE
jgi:hypothetical protein